MGPRNLRKCLKRLMNKTDLVDYDSAAAGEQSIDVDKVYEPITSNDSSPLPRVMHLRNRHASTRLYVMS